MRISGNTNDFELTSKAIVNNSSGGESVAKQGSEATNETPNTPTERVKPLDNSEETKVKVQEVVSKMNEMLKVNNSTSKFMYHEGLERFYVTVVDSQTEEVVKEIPPKKLLDAFYEMQKMLGMIVDEKI